MKSLLIGLCSLVLASQVYAASGELKATISAANSVSTYTNDGAKYVLNSVAGQSVVNIRGSGILSEVNTSEVKDLSAELPNATLGEYNVVTFQQLSETKAMMIIDSMESINSENMRTTISAEVELLSGKWSDIESGATLQLKATKEGEKQIEASKRQLAEQMKIVLSNQLSAEGLEVRSVSAKVKSSKGEVMTMSKTSLIIPSISMNAEIKISVRL
jgi:hypothetical protein